MNHEHRKREDWKMEHLVMNDWYWSKSYLESCALGSQMISFWESAPLMSELKSGEKMKQDSIMVHCHRHASAVPAERQNRPCASHRRLQGVSTIGMGRGWKHCISKVAEEDDNEHEDDAKIACYPPAIYRPVDWRRLPPACCLRPCWIQEESSHVAYTSLAITTQEQYKKQHQYTRMRKKRGAFNSHINFKAAYPDRQKTRRM